jgi:hypothetical protein
MSNSKLNFQPLSRIQRNHGLEHATLHVLSQKYPKTALAGMSSMRGFTILGDVTTEDVAEAAIEALKKLRSGETHLAMHRNCGTNFAVSGSAAGLAAWLGTIGSGKTFKKKLERLPLMMLLATLALILTRGLGPWVQKNISTSGEPGTLELERVETIVRGGVRMHHVTTRG